MAEVQDDDQWLYGDEKEDGKEEEGEVTDKQQADKEKAVEVSMEGGTGPGRGVCVCVCGREGGREEEAATRVCLPRQPWPHRRPRVSCPP